MECSFQIKLTQANLKGGTVSKLTLFVDNTEHSEPVIPIRWCVDKSVLDELKAQDVLRPFLFISVRHEENEDPYYHREVKRVLVPLDQGMEYIELDRAGKHSLNAVIVWTRYVSWLKDQARVWNSDIRESSLYRYVEDLNVKVFDPTGLKEVEVRGGGEWIRPIKLVQGVTASISVVIPREFFAKEPSAWEQWWVNLWFANTPFDQCAFRKRRILAYSVQPPTVLLWVTLVGVIRLLSGVFSTFVGITGINWGAILHPFLQDTSDVLPENRNRSYFKHSRNIFLYNKWGGTRPWYVRWLQPPRVVVIGSLAWVINYFGLWGIAAKVGVLAGIVLALAYAVTLLRLLVRWVANRKPAWKLPSFAFLAETESAHEKRMRKEGEKIHKREEKLRLELERKYSTEFSHVACIGKPLPVSVGALPKRNQTVHLRFRALKARVCRPFARA